MYLTSNISFIIGRIRINVANTNNAIMITAGDQIDAVFGATLSLSSMAAAGLGNLVSDVIGIQASSVIEQYTAYLGLPAPGLTAAQLDGAAAKRASVLGSMLGISVGCLLGLLPLWLMDDEDTRAYKKTFESLDADGSGWISFCELENFMHRMGIDLSRSASISS